MSEESPSGSPVYSDMPESADRPQFKAAKKIVRIRLPNNSYRTIPVATTTTVGAVVEKIASKLMIQNPDADYSECRLFLVLAGVEEVELEEHDFLGDILNVHAQSGDELTYKKAGEKFVDREEQLKQIEQQNRLHAQRKETLHEAMNSWMHGPDESAPSPSLPVVGDLPSHTPGGFGFLLPERQHFLPVLYGRYRMEEGAVPPRAPSSPPHAEARANASCPQLSPSSRSPNPARGGDLLVQPWDVQTSHLLPFYSMASSLSSLLLEKEASQRATKKSKAGGRSMFVDFGNPPTATQKREVCPCSKGTEIVVSVVMVNGWKCIQKEFLCHPNDSAIIGKAALEVALLEALPPHPNVVRYLYHDHPAPGQTRLFLSYYGRPLAAQLDALQPALSVALVTSLLFHLCNGVLFLHEYCLIHGNLHDGCVHLIVDPQGEGGARVRQLVVSDLMEAFPTNDLGCDVTQQRITRSITKPWFSAPELLQSTELQFNHLVDVFSIGMIGLSLLARMGCIARLPEYEGLATTPLLDSRSAWIDSLTQGEEYRLLDAPTRQLLHTLLACTGASSSRPNVLQLQEILWNNQP